MGHPCVYLSMYVNILLKLIQHMVKCLLRSLHLSLKRFDVVEISKFKWQRMTVNFRFRIFTVDTWTVVWCVGLTRVATKHVELTSCSIVNRSATLSTTISTSTVFICSSSASVQWLLSSLWTSNSYKLSGITRTSSEYVPWPNLPSWLTTLQFRASNFMESFSVQMRVILLSRCQIVCSVTETLASAIDWNPVVIVGRTINSKSGMVLS